MTDDQLLAFSTDHLYHDLEMAYFAGPLVLEYAEPKELNELIIKNALLESFLVHVRVLVLFLYYPVKIRDDVTADHYVGDANEWRKARGPMSEVLKEAVQRTNGEVAHLTRRRRAEASDRQWKPGELLQALSPPFQLFVSMTPHARLDWRIRQVAADLDPKGGH